MYKVKRGTVKVNGKDFAPGQPLPDMEQDDIESLLAEKLIEEAEDEVSIPEIAVLQEDERIIPTLAMVGDIGTSESVIPETDIEEENFDEAASDFSVDFNIDDYVATEPEKEVEEKPKAEHEHKKAPHKKGGK